MTCVVDGKERNEDSQLTKIINGYGVSQAAEFRSHL